MADNAEPISAAIVFTQNGNIVNVRVKRSHTLDELGEREDTAPITYSLAAMFYEEVFDAMVGSNDHEDERDRFMGSFRVSMESPPDPKPRLN